MYGGLLFNPIKSRTPKTQQQSIKQPATLLQQFAGGEADVLVLVLALVRVERGLHA